MILAHSSQKNSVSSFFWIHPQKSPKHLIHNLLCRQYHRKLKFFSSYHSEVSKITFAALKMKILHLPSVKGQNLHVYIIQNINFSRTLGVSGNPYFTTSLSPSHPSPSQEKMYFLSKKFGMLKLSPSRKEGRKTQSKLSPNWS